MWSYFIVIVLAPAEVLNTPCAPVDPTSAEALAVAAELMQVLRDHDHAAAVAAPQVGASLAMFAFRDLDRNPIVVSNPKVLETYGTQLGWESCLSIPDMKFMVQRPRAVVMTAQDIVGEHIRIKENGFYARMLLHEHDHLQGRLVTSRTYQPGVPR